MPIAVPAGVTVDIAENNHVTVKGPKGTLERTLPSEMDIKERNQRYIDSIATVAEANRGNGEGQWKIIRSYKLPSLGVNETGKIIDNVYCKIQKVGWKNSRPLLSGITGCLKKAATCCWT